jgi:hypothetical protein
LVLSRRERSSQRAKQKEEGGRVRLYDVVHFQDRAQRRAKPKEDARIVMTAAEFARVKLVLKCIS